MKEIPTATPQSVRESCFGVGGYDHITISMLRSTETGKREEEEEGMVKLPAHTVFLIVDRKSPPKMGAWNPSK